MQTPSQNEICQAAGFSLRRKKRFAKEQKNPKESKYRSSRTSAPGGLIERIASWLYRR
jgi:hypothetical protein